MPVPNVDLAILGGGCAGLSLAVRLAQSNLSVRVIEPRSTYENDRTWSFWRTRADPFQGCVRKEWTSWTIVGSHGQTTRDSSHLRYQTVESGAFYTHALDRIAASSKISLSLGVSAKDIVKMKDRWQINTTSGPFTATTVVDTRPPQRIPTYGQFFLGREIKTERPIFNSDVVQLMSFRKARSMGVDFVYILPFAADQALIEVTSFAPDNPGDQVFNEWLNAEILALDAGQIEIVRMEAGALPMEVSFTDHVPDGIIRMGLGGGGARPSTGYAFSRIQDHADHIADALIHGRDPNIVLDGKVTRFMDRVFLQVLTSNPAQGPALFEKLFRNTPRDRLERFLSGSTCAADRLSVMMSLPPRPFLQAAVFPK